MQAIEPQPTNTAHYIGVRTPGRYSGRSTCRISRVSGLRWSVIALRTDCYGKEACKEAVLALRPPQLTAAGRSPKAIYVQFAEATGSRRSTRSLWFYSVSKVSSGKALTLCVRARVFVYILYMHHVSVPVFTPSTLYRTSIACISCFFFFFAFFGVQSASCAHAARHARMRVAFLYA